ncbi:uncharacterized protein [Bactrocera oleae]|uniref:uncharacterized protein n=1 Tax=Bactrocera oleae TaxID=104688 RepID=UPI00387E74C9
MKIEISLMALLSVATISALSLEGYKCSDHAILTGDTVAPIRTVRICGVKDYVGAPSYANYQSSDSGIEKRAYPSVNLETLNYPLSKNIDTNSSNLKEEYHTTLQKLGSIDEEALQTKRSVEDVAASVKNIFDILKNTKTERTINVELHLEPSVEALLKKFLQLATVYISTESPVNVHTPKATKVSNESTSDENNTEERENTAETTEDYASWIRSHFGPATTTTEKYSD